MTSGVRCILTWLQHSGLYARRITTRNFSITNCHILKLHSETTFTLPKSVVLVAITYWLLPILLFFSRDQTMFNLFNDIFNCAFTSLVLLGYTHPHPLFMPEWIQPHNFSISNSRLLETREKILQFYRLVTSIYDFLKLLLHK